MEQSPHVEVVVSVQNADRANNLQGCLVIFLSQKVKVSVSLKINGAFLTVQGQEINAVQPPNF